MSSFIDDATQEAVEATRERRKEAFEAGRKKTRAETISEPRDTPLDKAKKSGSKSKSEG